MCYLVPGPTPCPEVVAVFYIRLAEVPTLFSVEGDAQVEQQNTVVGFLTTVLGQGPGARTTSRCSEVRAHTLICEQPRLCAPTVVVLLHTMTKQDEGKDEPVRHITISAGRR